VLSGSFTYAPDPIDPAAAGNTLLCCTQPEDDIVLDL
jgi:hypothetical protein